MSVRFNTRTTKTQALINIKANANLVGDKRERGQTEPFCASFHRRQYNISSRKLTTPLLTHSAVGPYNWNELRDTLPTLRKHSVVVTDDATLLEHLSKEQENFERSTGNEPATDRKNPTSTGTDLKELIQHSLDTEPSFPDGLPVGQVAGKFGLMEPSSFALDHAAAPLLQSYADHGCPVDAGPNWSLEQILAALERGPHQSAYEDGAVAFLREETQEKAANNYARVVKWGDIKDNLPANFKLSPVAMVPHKSKSFRCILDLTFRMKKKDGTFWESVNSKTTKLAPPETMAQLGTSVKRVVCSMANNYDSSRPFIFTKLDIKDGFWRLAVNDDDAWNFCYVLPSEKKLDSLDDIEIVVPNSLQMGWTESPPYFCAASETARDVIELILPRAASLSHHPLEDLMMPEDASADDTDYSSDDMSISDSSEDGEPIDDIGSDPPPIHPPSTGESCTLIEVFMDDFIAATNDVDPVHLRHTARAMLHAIHSVFPPPAVTGHPGDDPVSIKKILKGEGKWEHIKEILGWMINGVDYTIHLPPEKMEKIVKEIDKVRRLDAIPLNRMQKLAGKLQHASYAMPGGWGLFSPIQMAMRGNPRQVTLTPFLKETLKDWKAIIKELSSLPTHVLQLVDGYPDFLGYSDACKSGCGGIWMGITEDIGFIVWRVEFPSDIQAELVTWSNLDGTITMNDLELAGMIIEWLVLENIVDDLVFKRVGLNCDNSNAVSWTNKYRTAKSIPASRLLRLLCIRMHKRRVSPLLSIGINGDDNGMSDVSSRSFKDGKFFIAADSSLQSYFNKNFPLPQKKCWQEYKVPSELVSRVMSCVRGETLSLGSLLRLKGTATNIGSIGACTRKRGVSTPSSNKRPNLDATSSSQLLLLGSGQVSTALEIRSKFKPLLQRSQVSARPANWLENKAHSTEPQTHTSSQSNVWWKE